MRHVSQRQEVVDPGETDLFKIKKDSGLDFEFDPLHFQRSRQRIAQRLRPNEFILRTIDQLDPSANRWKQITVAMQPREHDEDSVFNIVRLKNPRLLFPGLQNQDQSLHVAIAKKSV